MKKLKDTIDAVKNEYDLSNQSDRKYWGGMLEKLAKEGVEQVNFGKAVAEHFKDEKTMDAKLEKVYAIVENIVKGANEIFASDEDCGTSLKVKKIMKK